MKHVDVKPSTYIYSSKENNQKNPILKTGDIVTISKYENDFEKGHTLHWSEELFVTKKVKSTVPRKDVVNDPNGEKTAGIFYEKNCK